MAVKCFNRALFRLNDWYFRNEYAIGIGIVYSIDQYYGIYF